MRRKYLVISIDALPDIYVKVQEAKEMVENNEVKNISEAVKIVGISRSSYYKYCDSIFSFKEKISNNTISLGLRLSHKSGVLSKILGIFGTKKANVLTIKQDPPSGGSANVVITFETTELEITIDELMKTLEAQEEVLGIIDVNI